MKAEIFSDIACPFCYIGTRRFAEALAAVPGRDEIEVVWRSFQLDPAAERRSPGDLLDHLSHKFNISRDEARAMNERVISMGRESEIEFDFENAFSVNTFDAHRMLQLATEEGQVSALADSFFGAYFTGSADLSDRDDLVRLAAEAGVDRERATAVAFSDEFGPEVRADQELATVLGITGVPAFVFDRKTALSGAQPVEMMVEALTGAVASR